MAHSTANKPKLLVGSLGNVNDVNLFCSGHCFQPDGNLLVVGGHKEDGVGVEQASVYNTWTDTWTAKTPMLAGRWYPSALTLADGRALVISGSTSGYFPLRDTLIWDMNRWVKVSPPPVLSLYPRLHLSPDGRVFMAGPQAQSLFLNVNVQGSTLPYQLSWGKAPGRPAFHLPWRTLAPPSSTFRVPVPSLGITNRPASPDHLS